MEDRRIELALPAGSLQCALYAFKGGANAVYFGLKSFSARKGAVNFSFEDVRKLKALCSKGGQYEGCRFYVTVNTIVDDADLSEVLELLRQLEYVQPDGLIVQDLGIARLIREHFPSLPLHGSTQLAVHTVNGVKELQSLGFTRVVLSRELSFEEISEIRRACPDVELKVFVHGALCYGFSGLCMASQFVAGPLRSANRGSCAQICRTWFTCSETKTDSWLFSMKDLCLGDKVRRYAELGIDSLKVEGRMKGPDYAYWCARYYSLLLDGAKETDQNVIWAKEAMQVSFSRDTTEYFFNTGRRGSTGSENMVCASDPGHKGIQVGTIDRVLANKAVVRFTKPVAIRDGLKVSCPFGSASFALSHIEGGKSFISEGETATINFPTSEFERKPGFGTPVHCISRHNLNMGLLSENLPLFKRPVDIDIRILPDGISVNGAFTALEVQSARSQSDLGGILRKVFEASDRSYFTLGKLSVDNQSGIGNPFLPMSILKQIRRAFYEGLDAEFEASLKESLPLEAPKFRFEKLPPRSALGLWDKVVEYDGKAYLPLSPLMFKEGEYLENLERRLSEHGKPVILGLNNIAQVHWAKAYLKTHPDLRVFLDVFLYTQNSLAYQSVLEELPCTMGSYELDSDTAFTYTGDDYTPPLFISRVCMRHHGLGLPCSGCSRDNTYHLEQNGHSYQALCRDCITIVTRS